MTGFSELRAPIYSKTLVDPDGKPATIGYAPVVPDRDASTSMRFLVQQNVYGALYEDGRTWQNLVRCPHGPDEVCRCPKPPFEKAQP